MKRRKDSKGVVLKEGEYERSNGTYEYKYRNRFGERKSIYGKTLVELREKENNVLRNLLDGIDSFDSNVSINDIFEIWKKIKRGLKDNTFKNYIYMYQQFVEPTFGKLKLSKLKRTDVRSFYNRLKEDGNLKVSTIDCVHTVLHQVLDLAVDDEYIRFNPSDNALKELKLAYQNESEKKRAMTLEQQKVFQDFLYKCNDYKRWYPIFYIMLWTGMRVGEITGLQWDDLDFKNNIINVNKTLVYYSKGKGLSLRYAINTTKTEAGTRKIPMTSEVKNAFLMEKELQEAFNVKCCDSIGGYNNFVFLNRFGNVHNNGTLNKALRRIVRDCNLDIIDKSHSSSSEAVLLPHLSNHILRHTFSTRLNENNVNVKVIQAILGHADVSTTMDIYVDTTEDFKNDSMREFEKSMEFMF